MNIDQMIIAAFPKPTPIKVIGYCRNCFSDLTNANEACNCWPDYAVLVENSPLIANSPCAAARGVNGHGTG